MHIINFKTMKKIFTLSFAAFFGAAAIGQQAVTPKANEFGLAKETNKKLYLVDGKVSEQITPRPANKDFTETYYIDYYDVERNGYAFGDILQAPQFYWTFQDSAFINTGVTFSHLFDFNNFEFYGFDSLEEAGANRIVLDSIHFNFGHKNHSGTPNILAISVKTIPNAGPKYNGSVIWSDTSTGTDFTPGMDINQLPVFSVPCGAELPTVNKGVYVEIHFDGPVNDTASFIANYYNCGSNCASIGRDGGMESFTYREFGLNEGFTHFLHDYQNQRFGELPGTYRTNLNVFYDCNSNGSYDRTACEAYAMQNMALGISISVDFIGGLEERQLKTAKIGQNYPNPFSGITTIDYTVEEPTNINLEVFDITGKSVLTVNEGLRSVGSYKLNIDGSDMKNGIYYYTFRTDSGAVTKKMIIQN